MIAPVAIENAWWIASRTAGILALVLMTLSMIAGLTLGGRLAGAGARGIMRPAALRSVHEQMSLAALLMIGLHAVTLLGDTWMKPSLADIAVPFVGEHEPIFTGLGIIAGYMAILFGASYYARDRFGSSRWRKIHRVVTVSYVLSVVHTLGAGSDAGELWLFVPTAAGAAIVTALFVLRITPSPRETAAVRTM